MNLADLSTRPITTHEDNVGFITVRLKSEVDQAMLKFLLLGRPVTLSELASFANVTASHVRKWLAHFINNDMVLKREINAPVRLGGERFIYLQTNKLRSAVVDAVDRLAERFRDKLRPYLGLVPVFVPRQTEPTREQIKFFCANHMKLVPRLHNICSRQKKIDGIPIPILMLRWLIQNGPAKRSVIRDADERWGPRRSLDILRDLYDMGLVKRRDGVYRIVDEMRPILQFMPQSQS